MRQLIITVDDFGLDTAVNEAVERAHCDGVLSCASLMVGAPAANDAVARAMRLPSLRVGLHLALVDGAPVLPPDQIPALVGADRRFGDDLVAAGIRWFFQPAARRQLADEIRAQFEAFRATGLPLDHVNGHNHMHLHPTVLGLILRLAGEFGVRHVRLPHEPLRLADDGAGPTERLAAAALAPWIRLMRRRLDGAGIGYNDVLIGMRASGHMTEPRLLRSLERLPDGVSEIYCHAAVARTDALVAAMPDYDSVGEFAALQSPRVAEALRRSGLTPTGFADLIR